MSLHIYFGRTVELEFATMSSWPLFLSKSDEYINSMSDATGLSVVTVRNHTENQKSGGVGYRQNGDVVFKDTFDLQPGKEATWKNSPDERFEFGIKITNGTHGVETFDGDSGDLTATITTSGIEFETDASDAEPVSVFDAEPAPAQSSDDSPSTNQPDNIQIPPSEQVYCRNCGSVISQYDELCSDCGVKNPVYEPKPEPETAEGEAPEADAEDGPPTGGATDTPTAEDGNSSSRIASLGIAGIYLSTGALVVTVLVSMLSFMIALLSGGAPWRPGTFVVAPLMEQVLPPLRSLAWIVLPISLFIDLRHLSSLNVDWPLRGRLYITVAALLPLYGLVFEFVALSLLFRQFAAIAFLGLLMWLGIRHIRTRKRLV